MKRGLANILCILALLLSHCLCPTDSAAQSDSISHSTPSDTIELNAITISASNVIKHKDRTDYIMTPRQRQQSSDIYTVLAQIPGIQYNIIDQSIRLYGSSEYAYTINSIPASVSQVNAISPDRIKKISIIHHPSGKWVSQGTRYVINIILKEENGIYMNIQNLLIAAPRNSNDILANEQPKAYFQYTQGKFTVNAGYGFGDINWNYRNSFKKEFPDGVQYSNNFSDGPTESNSSLNHNAYVSAIYKPNIRNSLYATLSYNFHRKSIRNDNSYSTASQRASVVDEITDSRTDNKDIRASLLWQSKLDEGWSMTVSANWNNINAEQNYTYRGITDGSENVLMHQVKNYSYQNIDISYNANERIKINFGANGFFNQYKTNDINTGNVTMDRLSGKAELYGYASINIRDDLSLYGGVKSGYVRDDDRNRFYAAPMLSLNYYPESIFYLDVSYSMEPSFPKQYQLDTTLYRLDSFLYKQGNSRLPQFSTSHTVTILTSLWDNLSFTNLFFYSPDEISDYYLSKDSYIISTYSPCSFFQYSSLLEYDWKINKNWQWSNSVQLNYFKVWSGNNSNQSMNITGHSTVQFYSEKADLTAQLEYWRDLNRIPTLNGFYETSYDMWNVSLSKHLLKKRLILSLSYVIPLNFGIRQSQRSLINSGDYRSANALDLNIYDNMVVFRLIFRFDKGKPTRSIQDVTNYDNENPIGRNLY